MWHHHEKALFDDELADKGPWGPGRTVAEIKAAEGRQNNYYEDNSNTGNIANGSEHSIITGGPFKGTGLDSAVDITNWDAETAPQHFRVIFAVYIGV